MAWVLAVLVTSVISGLGTGRAERAAERGISQRLGKVERVQVRIDRGHRSPLSRTVPKIEVTVKGFKVGETPSQALQVAGGERIGGKIGKIVIRAEDFEVGGLRVERMDATINSIRYDLVRALVKGRFRLTGMGESTVAVRLDGPSLERYLSSRVTALRDFRLRLLHGQIEVTGRTKTLVPVPVRLVARLEVKNKDEIHLAKPQIRVSSVPVPGFVVRRIMKQVNPIADLSGKQGGMFAPEIQRILIGPKGLSARGRIPPPQSRSAPR